MQTLLSAFMHMIGLFKCIENDENYLEIPRIEDLYFFLFDEILYNGIVYFQISPKLINLLNQIITIKPSLVQETIPRIEKIQQKMKSLENNTKTSLQNNTNKPKATLKVFEIWEQHVTWPPFCNNFIQFQFFVHLY